MDDIKAKQQIITKVKEATNILVTVSNDPSVDALSAALGLTLLFDKLDKHATAVFSGETPPAIAFLKPEDTFDSTTDSLQDFIIALDKEKADHLRYKVEGDAVKIFITPYKTTITSDDLEFSQGDFNVDLVIALGVSSQDHLDGALDAHGQILHDAAIITITAGEQTSDLGGIDWHDDQASSLSEMVTGLAEALKTDKTKSLLDGQIATAFLTGIVAQTERFSNVHTTSKVMTVAAQLMAAGADQQLVATKLAEEIAEPTPSEPVEEKVSEPIPEPAPSTSLNIRHEPTETLEQMDKRVKAAEQAEAAEAAEEALEEVAPAPEVPSLPGPYAPLTPEPEPTPVVPTQPSLPPLPPLPGPAVSQEPMGEPSFGGTLNATTDQAADDNRKAIEEDQNKTILSHAYLGAPASDATTDLYGAPVTPGSESVNQLPEPAQEVSGAYAAVEEALQAQPTPTTIQQLDYIPTEPAQGSPYAPAEPERLGDILAPEPPVVPNLPPPPVFPVSTGAPMPPLPPLPPVPPLPPLDTPVAAPVAPAAPAPNDPAQFKIPGQ